MLQGLRVVHPLSLNITATHSSSSPSTSFSVAVLAHGPGLQGLLGFPAAWGCARRALCQRLPMADGRRDQLLAALQAAISSSNLFEDLADEASNQAISVLDGYTSGDSFRLWWRDRLLARCGDIATQEVGGAIVDLDGSGRAITAAVLAIAVIDPASCGCPSHEGGAVQQSTPPATQMPPPTPGGVQGRRYSMGGSWSLHPRRTRFPRQPKGRRGSRLLAAR